MSKTKLVFTALRSSCGQNGTNFVKCPALTKEAPSNFSETFWKPPHDRFVEIRRGFAGKSRTAPPAPLPIVRTASRASSRCATQIATARPLPAGAAGGQRGRCRCCFLPVTTATFSSESLHLFFSCLRFELRVCFFLFFFFPLPPPQFR